MLWSLWLFTYIIDLLILTRRRCFFRAPGPFAAGRPRQVLSGASAPPYLSIIALCACLRAEQELYGRRSILMLNGFDSSTKYVASQELMNSVNVAMALKKPLLIKESLARARLCWLRLSLRRSAWSLSYGI